MLYSLSTFTFVLCLFAWLFLVLPLFDSIHHRFFQTSHREIFIFKYADWYFAFFKALRQRPAKEPKIEESLARRGLLYLALVCPLIAFAMLPLSSALNWDGQPYFFDIGSDLFSPFLIVAFLYVVELIHFLIGLTFERHFIAQLSIEKSAVRQGCILIFTGALISLPLLNTDSTLRYLVELQTPLFLLSLPSWGVFQNPISFVCVCFAMIIFLRQWQDDEYPSVSALPKSPQSELLGTELVSLKIARSLKYLLLYAFIVTSFLGGPFISDPNVNPILALVIFTGKIFLLAIALLAIHYYLPQISRAQLFRTVFLLALPAIIIGYPISLLLREFFKFN